MNIIELIKQAIGEFSDRFSENNLETVFQVPEENIYILGDGRSTYRIIENLFSNVNKYALRNTRVYVDVSCNEEYATIQVKNISAGKLGISGDELMERFVRGDLSRNSEGSGLGLSIAKSLATLQHGDFDIILDGDLFKAVVNLPIYSKNNENLTHVNFDRVSFENSDFNEFNLNQSDTETPYFKNSNVDQSNFKNLDNDN